MSALIKLAVALVILGLVSAVEKPCCISKKWTGKMQITTAYLIAGTTVPVISQNRLMFDYDRDMKMERAIGENRLINGTMDTTVNYTVYNDHGHMKRYVMTGMDSCHVEMDTDDQVDPCVPSTLQHSGTFKMGSRNVGVTVNAWTGVYENFTYTMLTDVIDCTPVTMSRFGIDESGTRITENREYVDVTQYMTSPGAFDLPDACKMGDMAVGK